MLSAQIERYFAKSWQVPKFGDGAVSDWINKKSNQLAKVTAVPFYQRFQHYCGSSAGATALVGFDAGLAGKAVLRVCMIAQRCSAQHWIAQHSAVQRSIAQQRTAQHSTVQHSAALSSSP